MVGEAAQHSARRFPAFHTEENAMLTIRKDMGVDYALVAAVNSMRKTIAVAGSKYHADTTSGATTGDFRSPTTTTLQVLSANATNTGTGITLANEIKAVILRHLVDVFAHSIADTIVTISAVPAASDDATTITLATAIQTAWNAHGTASSVHYTNDSNTDATSITTAATARTSLNAVKALINTHIASAPLGNSINLIDP